MDFLADYSGFLLGDAVVLTSITSVLFFLTLGFFGAPFLIWAAAALTILVGFGAGPVWLGATIVAAILFGTPIRRALSWVVMTAMDKLGLLPHISETEQTALRAGNVWVEREFFKGNPDFKILRNTTYPELTAEEKAFMDGPVTEICEMVDEYQIWQDKDLPAEVWDFLKKERFLGMIIPKEYGGLGFSAKCHSEVIQKLASRSIPLCISVMVPNSLGPAELLNHYGTEEQKKYYLPRLAVGTDLPAFALTEPTAGSDAGAIQALGTVFKDSDGELKMRLNWNKRWITLAAISTVLGMAFRLRDPEHLMGEEENLGITCALIPTSTKGVVLGQRHDPLGVPFYNCPTQGHDVVVSLDAIIGGPEQAGQGWAMLMESLAAGRGISLPAQSVGGAKLVTRVTGAHAVIRKQFGVSIGKFEGVEEPLARIGGMTYLLDAMRNYTLGAIDAGVKPPVVTAIAKYQATELFRTLINDGMDVRGGAGISRGPRNVLANGYIAAPIGVTVEGANILTRTLIIFGQGALRGHPHVFPMVDAVTNKDVKSFDKYFWAMSGHIVQNLVRAFVLSASRGLLYLPPTFGPTARYYQKLAWASATFALMTDLSMGLLGGSLKMKGKITGRFADVLSWLYIGTATLRRWEYEGRKPEDLKYVHWAMKYAFHQIQVAFDGIFANMDVPVFGLLFKGPVKWWSTMHSLGSMPTDRQGHEVAVSIQKMGDQRDRLTAGIHVDLRETDPIGRLEHTMKLLEESAGVMKKIRKAVKTKQIPKTKKIAELIAQAIEKNIITQDEASLLEKAELARNDAIQVDSYTLDEYKSKSFGASGKPTSDEQGEKKAPASL